MFRVVPLETALAERIRQTMVDDFGNKLAPEESEGGPCRHCLKRAKPGESLILFSHRPFTQLSPYSEVGPVYVHAEACERYEATDIFPPEFKAGRTMTIRAYDVNEHIVDAKLATETEVEGVIEELFGDPAVAFIHARFSAYGCYACRIERA